VTVYAYAEIGRFGLAHSLSAWARCIVWADRHDVRIIAPIWLRPRIGPYLRRERDKRSYFKLFRTGCAITGLTRFRLLLTSSKVPAGVGYPDLPVDASRNIIVQFENTTGDNERRFFPFLVGHHELVRTKLLEITRPRYHPADSKVAHIAIHVRLGDFSIPKDSDVVIKGLTNVRLPIEWYADRLSGLRAQLGADLPAIVYSDGDDDALQILLEMPGVRRAPHQESITDLLAMGQSAALISSGSGFSLWGAYLGGVPRLCHPGQIITSAYNIPDMEVESDYDGILPAGFLNFVRDRIGSSNGK
jgi:hypothetical protein